MTCKIGKLDDDRIMLQADTPLQESFNKIRDDSFSHFAFIKDTKVLADTGSVTLEEFCRIRQKTKYRMIDGITMGMCIFRKYSSGIVCLGKSKLEFSTHLTL